MDERLQSNRPVDQPVAVSRGLHFAILSFAIIFPLAFCVLLKPVAAHAAWVEFARMMNMKNSPEGAVVNALDISESRITALNPQQQAELLLEAAVDHSRSAAEQISNRAEAWRGRLHTTPRLSGLLNSALNSPDLGVRSAAIEAELAANNLAKNSRTADLLAVQIAGDRAARPWGLWMLGALGSRGIEPDRALATLVGYSRDPNEKTRYWAVEGLSVLGTSGAIQALLHVLREDSSPAVREGAACGLAQSGTFTKEQRMTAIPALIHDAGDASLDVTTHGLVYRALRDITGAQVEDDPSAWQEYWSENARH